MNEGIQSKVLALAGYHPSRRKNWEKVVLEPGFWQALGKALGWRKNKLIYDMGEMGNVTEVHYFAYMYFELVLTGGDTEKFWEDLLPAGPKDQLT